MRAAMKRSRLAAIPVASGLALAFASVIPAAAQEGGWARMLGPQLEKYHQPEVTAAYFFNRHIGWVVGGHARDRAGKNQETFIFRTADGGASWERLTLYDGQKHVPDFVDIGFADANNGWLLSAGDLVLRTTDGGRTWEPVEPLPRGWGQTLLVLSPDAVMVGGTSTNGRQINITTDGGRSWRNSTVTSDGRDNVVDLAVAPDGSFFAVIASAMQNHGGVYRSDDGGRSWTAVVEGKEPLYTIAFSGSGQNGVAAGDKVAYSTTDGGSNWQRVPAAGARYATKFLDERNVVAFGHEPALLISGDGGRTWRPGSGPELGYSFLVDVQIVDPGWWLVAGGRGAYDLFRYEDPDHAAPIAGGRLPLPNAVEAPDGTVLPPGLYQVDLVHVGLDHAMGLRLVEPAEGIRTGVDGGEPGAGEYACEPCEAAFPVDADYELHELAEGQDAGSLFKLSLEPTATGAAVVVETAVAPPRHLHLALAALGASQDSDIDASEQVSGESEKKEEGGGLFGRLKKAASGDVRGAVQGAVNPEAATERYEAANAGPSAVYRVTVRYPLELFGGDAQ
jgi:photosystem II stability/assembly factor-like uncharacterized protein